MPVADLTLAPGGTISWVVPGPTGAPVSRKVRPGQSLTGQPVEVIALAAAHWTGAAIAAYRAADQAAAPNLAQRKAAAERSALAQIDVKMYSVTGPLPITEPYSWEFKAAAAAAFLDPGETASETQLAMLAAEAAVTGESVADLAALILVREGAYAPLAGACQGLRRVFQTALVNAATDAQINAAVAALTAGLAAIEVPT